MCKRSQKHFLDLLRKARLQRVINNLFHNTTNNYFFYWSFCWEVTKSKKLIYWKWNLCNIIKSLIIIFIASISIIVSDNFYHRHILSDKLLTQKNSYQLLIISNTKHLLKHVYSWQEWLEFTVTLQVKKDETWNLQTI